MPGPASGQSLRGRLGYRSVERGLDRARGDHHGPADPPPPPLVVQRWVARLSEHPGAGLSTAEVDRQARTPGVGGPCDGDVDANRQAAR